MRHTRTICLTGCRATVPRRSSNSLLRRFFLPTYAPVYVRACFRSDDASSSSSSLQRVLVYALLIAKAKIRREMLASFAQHNGLFERECFEQPVVQKLIRKLRKIPLYPHAEPNTTYLSYLQQGRFSHYEVNNRETGALEAIEFVKKRCALFVGHCKTKKKTRRSRPRKGSLMRMTHRCTC